MTSPSLSSLFFFFVFIFVTHAFDLSLIQMEAGICPYTVVVMTSCLSPDSTRDQISIAFGDADGNQVYAPGLGGSVKGSGRLGKCSTDTFQVKGQCVVNPICSVYIYRSGPDGWVPESIEIYSETSKSIKFDLSKSVPQNTWYGLNNCNTTGRPSSPPEFPPHTPAFPSPPPPETPAFPSPPPPEFPPETPAFPPPTPSRPSAASRRGDGESVFLTFVIAAAIAINPIVG